MLFLVGSQLAAVHGLVGAPGLGALDDDSHVDRPFVVPETTIGHELLATVGLWTLQLGSAVLRPVVVAQVMPLCRSVVAARLGTLEGEALMSRSNMEVKTSG